MDTGIGEGSSCLLPDPDLAFPAVFAQRVATSPDQPALCEVTFRGSEPQATSYSFRDLDHLVRKAAALLTRGAVNAGDRVALCVGSPSIFVSFFIAAHALGAVPVPLPSGSDFRAHAGFRERVGAACGDCEPRVVVDDTGQDWDSLWRAEIARPRVLDAREGLAGADAAVRPPLDFHRSFGETAFIQYTSGSTAAPKGVVVTHRNLIENMRASAEVAGLGPADRSVSWLPLYHDMGLIGGMLLGLYLGAGTFVMRTRSFLGRPDSWLRAISKFKGTFACAPNFAYDMLARRLPERALAGLDLSNWRLAFNGAEPIDHVTVREFARRFAAVGLPLDSVYPVYGMAECTLAISLPTPGAPVRLDFVDRPLLGDTGRASPTSPDSPSAACFTCVGRALPGHRVRIVEPSSGRDLPDRQLGEIVATGPSVTPGYFRGNECYATPREEVRTGDLGYLVDGELYVVDRIKDILILGGQNVVPSDVERVVANLAGVRPGSVIAFAMRGPVGTDDLYLVVGVEPRTVGEADLPQRVRQIVQEYFALVPRDVVLVKPGAVPKTTSGKVRRTMCRELYQRGVLTRDCG